MERAITFRIFGNEITGKISGDAKRWVFESATAYFKRHFGSGLLTNNYFENNTPNAEQSEIHRHLSKESKL